MIKKVHRALRTQGVSGLFLAARRRLWPDRLRYYSQCEPLLASRVGLEIGGPSPVFAARGFVPAYTVAARIDNCNFGARTVWEGNVTEGDTFVFDPRKPPGRQYVAEASDLQCIQDEQYDFVLSSHCIEHLANPLRGVMEWIRVLKDKGLLVLVVPHKDGTFDRRRPVTSMDHLKSDFAAQVTERDLTHLDEILKLHDFKMDPEAEGGIEAFAERSKSNYENRCLHHHVFDTRLVVDVVSHVGLQIIAVEAFRPFHIVVVAQKVPAGQAIENQRFGGVRPCWVSPFRSDRASY